VAEGACDRTMRARTSAWAVRDATTQLGTAATALCHCLCYPARAPELLWATPAAATSRAPSHKCPPHTDHRLSSPVPPQTLQSVLSRVGGGSRVNPGLSVYKGLRFRVPTSPQRVVLNPSFCNLPCM
jgi:hypothetical protein